MTDSDGTEDPQGLDATSPVRPRRARGAAKSGTDGSSARTSTPAAKADLDDDSTDDDLEAEDDLTDDGTAEDTDSAEVMDEVDDDDVGRDDAEQDEAPARSRRSKRRAVAATDEDADGEDEFTTTRTKRRAAAKDTASESGVAARTKTTAKRDAPEPRANALARIWRYYREVVAELRKVIWPTRRELVTYTTVVVIFVAIIVALVAGLDYVFARGVLKVFG